MSHVEEQVRKAMLMAAMNAAAGGHDLAGFTEREDALAGVLGWQAVCRRCGEVVLVSDDGTTIDLLSEACDGRQKRRE